MRIQYQILVPGQSPKRGQFQGNFSISDIEVSIVAGTKNSTNPWLQASCNFLGKIVNDPDKSSDVDPQHVAMIEEALNSQMFPFVNKIFSDICTNANVGTQNAINFVLQDYTPQAMFPLTLSTEIKWDRSILDAKVTADGAIFLVNGTFVDYPVPPSPAPTFADFNISLGQVQTYIDWNLAGELLNVSIGSDYNSFLFTDETAIPHFSMVMGKFYGIETTEGKIAANYDASARLAINCTWPAEEKPVLDLTSPGNLHAILTYRCALLTYDEQSKPVDTKIAFLSKFRAEFGVNSLTMRSALNLTVKSFQQQAETVVLNAKPLTPERQRILDRTVLYYAQQYRLAKDIETLGKYWPIPDMKNANYEKLESYLHVFGDVPEA